MLLLLACWLSGGLTESMMMLWLPSFLICSWAASLAPVPMASMAMTEQTPNMMPSMVKPLRSLCIQRLLAPNFSTRFI